MHDAIVRYAILIVTYTRVVALMICLDCVNPIHTFDMLYIAAESFKQVNRT